MGTRRSVGERVTVHEGDDRIVGVIEDQPGPHRPFIEWCIWDCGDPDCREWANVVGEDGERMCHVSECRMTTPTKEGK